MTNISSIQRTDDMLDSNSIENKTITINPRLVELITQSQTLPIKNTQMILNPLQGYAEQPLLPLSKACTPLNDIFHNLSFYVQQALNETPEQPKDGLTIDESASIRLYTLEWEKPHRKLPFEGAHLYPKPKSLLSIEKFA
ncbi:hypothetical protein I4U23_005799 [Adineta vaga]|nr:hypothetical protein I4U23_005799 [Adineta vaga]